MLLLEHFSARGGGVAVDHRDGGKRQQPDRVALEQVDDEGHRPDRVDCVRRAPRAAVPGVVRDQVERVLSLQLRHDDVVDQ
eukprot:SAG11_NODE_4_length_33019_cov_28.098909_8_plen_81_part_00